MTVTSEELLAYLEDHGIEAVTYEHAPVHTVEESQKLRGEVPGVHTKNLFLRDSKKAFFLVVTNEAVTVNLKDLRHKIDARGGLSFGTPEALLELLGVTPGAVSLLPVIDESLLQARLVNCHPLSNRRTTSLSAEGILGFLATTGHLPLRISFANDGNTDLRTTLNNPK